MLQSDEHDSPGTCAFVFNFKNIEIQKIALFNE